MEISLGERLSIKSQQVRNLQAENAALRARIDQLDACIAKQADTLADVQTQLTQSAEDARHFLNLWIESVKRRQVCMANMIAAKYDNGTKRRTQ